MWDRVTGTRGGRGAVGRDETGKSRQPLPGPGGGEGREPGGAPSLVLEAWRPAPGARRPTCGRCGFSTPSPGPRPLSSNSWLSLEWRATPSTTLFPYMYEHTHVYPPPTHTPRHTNTHHWGSPSSSRAREDWGWGGVDGTFSSPPPGPARPPLALIFVRYGTSPGY